VLKKFEEQQQQVKVILAMLEREPLRWDMLLRRVVGLGNSVGEFNGALYWLKNKGFVLKADDKRTAPYSLSPKGKQYLAGLRAGE
jgi:hypothetical protein